MKIYIGSDHAGFAMKEILKKFLAESSHTIEDKGAFSYSPEDDYPDFIRPVAEAVAKEPESRGIILGSSGQGEAIVANRIKGIRATVFYGPPIAIKSVYVDGNESNDPYEIVRLMRRHNNANILSFGARFVSDEAAKKAVELFLETKFEGGRHEQRIKKIDNA